MADKKYKKIVLAYSGGLDTSIIIPWLKENYDNPEIIAVAGNVGLADELDGLEEKALATGASKLIIADLMDEMVDDVIIPSLKMGAKYETYLLGTAFARPVTRLHQSGERNRIPTRGLPRRSNYQGDSPTKRTNVRMVSRSANSILAGSSRQRILDLCAFGTCVLQRHSRSPCRIHRTARHQHYIIWTVTHRPREQGFKRNAPQARATVDIRTQLEQTHRSEQRKRLGGVRRKNGPTVLQTKDEREVAVGRNS